MEKRSLVSIALQVELPQGWEDDFTLLVDSEVDKFAIVVAVRGENWAREDSNREEMPWPLFPYSDERNTSATLGHLCFHPYGARSGKESADRERRARIEVTLAKVAHLVFAIQAISRVCLYPSEAEGMDRKWLLQSIDPETWVAHQMHQVELRYCSRSLIGLAQLLTDSYKSLAAFLSFEFELKSNGQMDLTRPGVAENLTIGEWGATAKGVHLLLKEFAEALDHERIALCPACQSAFVSPGRGGYCSETCYRRQQKRNSPGAREAQRRRSEAAVSGRRPIGRPPLLIGANPSA